MVAEHHNHNHYPPSQYCILSDFFENFFLRKETKKIDFSKGNLTKRSLTLALEISQKWIQTQQNHP